MRLRFRALALALATLPCWPVAAARAQPKPSPAAEVERRVEDLLGRMTLAERIGQLHLAPNSPSFDLGEVRRGEIGAVLGFTGGRSIAAVQRAARESRLGIPLLVGLDVLHGLRTMFPLGLGEAATFDPGLARAAAESAARDSVAIGLNWTFAPMADLARDPRWGRIVEGFGEDPHLGEVFTRARVEGFRAGGLAATLKHFAGYGAAQGGRDYDSVDLAFRELLDRYLPAFRAGIEAGAESVMSAFHALNGVPATASRALLTGILRERWAFDGFVVSDWYAIAQLVPHGVAAGPAEAALAAFRAGVDVDMADGLYRDHLAAAVRDGRVPEAAVTEAARRVLRAKVRMGLFERPLPPEADDEVPPPSPEARALSRRVAADSIVLLRNDGTLPLRPGLRIALVGGLAEDAKDLVGPHGALVRYADGVSVRQGLEARAARAGATIGFAPGCDAGCGASDGFAAAEAAARDADVVVAVMGETGDVSGEGGSRAYLTLPGRQPELLARLLDTGKPVVVVIVAGRPIELGRAVDRLAGLAMAWFPGTEGGNAVADILFGDVEPSGKLPVSWPRTIGQVPIPYDRAPTGRPFAPNNRYTLRYVDEELTPLHPFGFGLAYTRFRLSDLAIATPLLGRGGTVEVQVRVANAGPRPGREVVQLYIRQPVASLSRPLRQLKGFEKVALRPGESRTLTLRVPVDALGFHREDGTHVVEPGRYEMHVGTSSDTTLMGTVEVVP